MDLKRKSTLGDAMAPVIELTLAVDAVKSIDCQMHNRTYFDRSEESLSWEPYKLCKITSGLPGTRLSISILRYDICLTDPAHHLHQFIDHLDHFWLAFHHHYQIQAIIISCLTPDKQMAV
jgi:hypothetical protein